MYGITEKQFRKTFDRAGKMRGIHGDNFLYLLESRLDNVVFRAGYATTRRASRQLVNHGHFLVNGKKITIPSYEVNPGDKIELREKSQNLKHVLEAIDSQFSTLPFVTMDKKSKVAEFVRLPDRTELNRDINPQLIVEFYSR